MAASGLVVVSFDDIRHTHRIHCSCVQLGNGTSLELPWYTTSYIQAMPKVLPLLHPPGGCQHSLSG